MKIIFHILRRFIAVTILISLVPSAHATSYDAYQQNDRGTLYALNKITGHIKIVSMHMNQAVQFGTLKIKMTKCLTSRPDQIPETLAFIQVHEHDANRSDQVIFMGWIFASTPTLSALEHPVYDIWIKECHSPLTSALESGRHLQSGNSLSISPSESTAHTPPVELQTTSELSQDPIEALCEELDDTPDSP